ncbi:HEAT repeat domain-containing protein [Schlesneria sp. DSM 10557]|uniref:HEAT repeat domain-containing protein n=1 Tax=Schlesneria sp. DSM 10557 TaxID=3044399 RepID=UPI0035A165C1
MLLTDKRRFAMLYRIFTYVMVFTIAIVSTACAEIVPDFLMESDPDCRPLPPAPVQPMPKHLQLWFEVLKRPETDYQRMAAESISLAHKKGVPDLLQAIPTLETILTTESTHPAARYAAARALITLDSRDSASKLLEWSQKGGSDLRQLVEPALADWDFEPIRTVWKERLDASNKQHRRELLLAVRGLARVQEVSALPTLRNIALDVARSPDIRLAAAAAAGALAETGLESDAQLLQAEKRKSPIINRRCAIHLLQRHTSEAAIKSLLELATEQEPTLAAAALERLNQIDSHLVLPLAEGAMKNLDANVRMQGAIAYIKLPTTDRIPALAELLNDLHPGIRQHVSTELLRLAQDPALDETIRSTSMAIAQRDQWQGQEQSALLLGSLEHQPASTRFVELLESERREVMVSSAWALRKIADPATASAIVDKIRRQTIARKNVYPAGLDQQVAHLLEACGKMQVKQAERDMIGYIPKVGAMGERSRGAAIWALGKLHTGTPDPTVAELLIDRVNDEGTMPPEFILIKQLSIVSLGRMKAQEYAPEFRNLLEKGNSNDAISLARRWALKELTGEEYPLPEADPIGPGTWFLNPLVRAQTNSP